MKRLLGVLVLSLVFAASASAEVLPHAARYQANAAAAEVEQQPKVAAKAPARCPRVTGGWDCTLRVVVFRDWEQWRCGISVKVKQRSYVARTPRLPHATSVFLTVG